MKKTGFVLLLLLTVFALPPASVRAAGQITAAWTDGKLTETLDYTFVPDADAVGEWEVYDFTERVSRYNPARPQYDMRGAQYRGHTVYDFGRVTQRFGDVSVHSAWTKGFIVSGFNNTVPRYELKRVNGAWYMFVESKDSAYIESGESQGYYVFKRTGAAPSGTAADAYRAAQDEYDALSRVPAAERVTRTDMRVPIRVMWLLYPNGVMDGKVYTMSDSHQQTVRQAMADFKTGVEKATRGNVEIFNDYTLVFRTLDISGARPEAGGAFIDRALVQADIDQFAPEDAFHFVFTVSAVDTRPVRGVGTGCLWAGQAYANCYFAEGDETNAGVAVHEFIHALEIDKQPGVFPGVDVPLRHALTELCPGYEAYYAGGARHETADRFDPAYHMRGYEKAFFEADVVYTDPATGEKRYTGVFPSMWAYFDAVRNHADR